MIFIYHHFSLEKYQYIYILVIYIIIELFDFYIRWIFYY
jgi:hypothetical protein